MGVRESFITSVTGYEIAGTDIKNLAEPYDQNGGVNTGKVTFSPYKRTGTSDTLNKQFASPTASWNTLTTNFKINGSAVKLAQRGCVPTSALQFASLTSTGTYEIKRGSDGSGDYIKIGSTYYRASSFGSLGFVPYVIGCIFSGGGGGAGGHGGKTGNKYGWNATCGGGGGGGGICVVKIDFRNGYYCKLTLGAGGSCGTNNSQATAGTAGSAGGSSKIVAYDNSTDATKGYCTSNGGSGGGGGKTGTDGDFQGSGGSGGSTSSSSWVAYFYGVSGGKGGTSSDGGTSTAGESISKTTKFDGSYSRAYGGAGGSAAFDSSDSGRGSTRAGGGGSLGAGATNSSYATAGGGGACYYYNETYFNGANGAACFYY